jgi:hypothetical protein
MPRPSFPGAEFPGAQSDRQFNNADSFAAAFDDAWRSLSQDGETERLSRVEKLEKVLSQVSEHPFAQMDASRAREVGEFRLRLHGL